MIGIYLITNNANGKMYVGQSVNLEQRMRKHRSKLSKQTHNNEHLQSAWNKYGEDAFSFEVIETCDKEELDEKERHYIKLYGTQDRTKGYNIEGGGNSNKEMSEETKRKLSNALSGRTPWNKGKHMSDEFKRKDAEAHTGKLTSAETRRKMSMARLGHATTQETKDKIGKANSKPIACVEFEEMGAVFQSTSSASRKTGISRRSINNCLCGLSQTAGGLHWRYLEKGEI